MAPRKSIPLKNPISRHGSSSFSSLPSVPIRDKSRNSKSHKDFDERMGFGSREKRDRLRYLSWSKTGLTLEYI